MSFDKKVTIAHLSDLHFASKNDRYLIARLDVMFAEFVRRRYDHLVMTGDLIDTASPVLWTIIRDALVRHGLFDWTKTTVIPGNHDLIDLEEEMRFYNALNPDDRSRQRRLDHRLRQFNAVFRPLISGDGGEAAGVPFVKVMRFGQIALSFVAVNTVDPWSGADNPLGARGSVSHETLKALREPNVRQALDESFVIGLCHHAYKVYGTGMLVDQAFDWTMEFKNRDEYLGAMKGLGAKLVLHGHFHRFQVYQVGGMDFINGGSFRYSPERYGELTIGANGRWSHRFVNLALKR
ncbi:metallophosphoesterase [Chlorobaculum sp. 24CR]|uniref:metallophosphoesterase family protein n=1 Tax=Chlorobaculum sp. 24CR TaxID=2508878 RepID=UPI00100B634E|nr:metallophosphoesterase [Chlorobaculum sp. 24CR]RXK89088.1 metallophosphoesterase [Chlorobaculum sp. 24CR]